MASPGEETLHFQAGCRDGMQGHLLNCHGCHNSLSGSIEETTGRVYTQNCVIFIFVEFLVRKESGRKNGLIREDRRGRSFSCEELIPAFLRLPHFCSKSKRKHEKAQAGMTIAVDEEGYPQIRCNLEGDGSPFWTRPRSRPGATQLLVTTEATSSMAARATMRWRMWRANGP